MPKVLVEFDSIEQAQAAVAAIQTATAQPVYAPAPSAPQYAPAPQGFTPPAPPPQYAPAPQPTVPPVAQAPAAPAQQIQLSDLTSAAQAYAKAHGPKAAKAKMSEFGVPSMAQLSPDKWAAALAAFQVQ